MQNLYEAPVDGIEVQRADLNTIAKEASLAEDRVFNELTRPTYNSVGNVDKKIFPYGLRRADLYGTYTQHQGVLSPTGAANATVHIRPFRAVLGMRTSDTNPDGARSTHVEAFTTSMQFAATVSSNRWDLVYARVNVDAAEPDANRYVKEASGNIGVQSVSLFKKTSITINKVQGVEASNPTRPSLPTDVGNSYYIPLGYVLVQHPHTLTSIIAANQIQECAPIAGIAPAAGGCDVQPCDYASRAAVSGGNTGIPNDWTPANGRPREYLPTTMVGKVERFIALDFLGGHASLPLNADTILDESIDWRRRFFKTTVCAYANGRIASVGNLAAVNTLPQPAGYDPTEAVTFMGQSMTNSLSAAYTIPGGIGRVATLTDSGVTLMASGSLIVLYVDSTSGALKVDVGSTNPTCILFLWIDATGPYSNVL